MSRTEYLLVGLSYLSFVTLGVAGAIIGVLWSPHIMNSFNESIGNLGALLLSVTLGYVLTSMTSGQLFTRFQVGYLMATALFITAASFVGYTLVPSYGWMVVCGLGVGIGTGLLDGGMNIYFAAYFDARLLNWLHAAFGVGSLLAPQLVNVVVLGRGGDWREAFVIMAVATAVIGALFVVSAPYWQRLQTNSGETLVVPLRRTLQLPIVWLGVAIFICYTGTEASAGTWSAPFFTSQGIAPLIANNWVTLYWLSFTVGRIVFGIFINRLNPQWVVRGCLIGAVVGAALIVWRPFPEMNAIGIAIYGFMLSPIFALMITGTQDRLGPLVAPAVIGLQVAAASLGGGVFQALIGRMTEAYGLEIVPWTFVVVSLVMLILYQRSLAPRFDLRKRL